MARRRKHYRLPRRKPGAAPGTLIAPENAQAPRINIMAYDAEKMTERAVKGAEEVKGLVGQFPVLWVNIDGLGSVKTLEDFGALFGLHALALEDVLNTRHRPKTDIFESYIFAVARMASLRDGQLDMEQVSLFLGSDYVLTFQEDPYDCLDPVRARIRDGHNRALRKAGSDYLAYALLDAIIDGYFPVLEHYGDALSELEDEIVKNPQSSVIGRAHDVKRDLQTLRHGLWPMREMISGLLAAPKFMGDDLRPYLRDCHDHIINLLDILETYRERAAGLTDIYLSSTSAKMNEIMKVLTIIATIFMPLSFIASVYGMNFDTSSPFNMPELHWKYGYFFALGLMAALAGGMTAYFISRGWLGGKRP